MQQETVLSFPDATVAVCPQVVSMKMDRAAKEETSPGTKPYEEGAFGSTIPLPAALWQVCRRA